MDQETLADHLRRATRNFTSRLPEERVFTIGQALAAELARAHAETPARHPDIDPDTIPMADGAPRLTGGSAAGEASEDLFQLGCLLSALALGTPADPSWRLDGPPPAELSTVRRSMTAPLRRRLPRRVQRRPSHHVRAPVNPRRDIGARGVSHTRRWRQPVSDAMSLDPYPWGVYCRRDRSSPPRGTTRRC